MPLPGGWGGRGEGVGLLQEDLHHRHQGHPGRGGGVDTEPGHVSPALSSAVNVMIKVSLQRALLCAQQHPVPGGHAHRIGGDRGRLHQGKYPAEA